MKNTDITLPVKPKHFFGGKIDGFSDNRDRHFNQRMLKAYLRGQDRFAFGFTTAMNQFGVFVKVNQYHDVLFTDQFRDKEKLETLLANGYTNPGKVFGGTKLSKRQLKDIIDKRLEANEAHRKAMIALNTTKDAISEAGIAGSKAGKAIAKMAKAVFG